MWVLNWHEAVLQHDFLTSGRLARDECIMPSKRRNAGALVSVIAAYLAAYKLAQDMLPSISEFTVVAFAYKFFFRSTTWCAQGHLQSVYTHGSATATHLRPI